MLPIPEPDPKLKNPTRQPLAGTTVGRKQEPRNPVPDFFFRAKLRKILNIWKNTPENSEKYSPKIRFPEAKSCFPTPGDNRVFGGFDKT